MHKGIIEKRLKILDKIVQQEIELPEQPVSNRDFNLQPHIVLHILNQLCRLGILTRVSTSKFIVTNQKKLLEYQKKTKEDLDFDFKNEVNTSSDTKPKTELLFSREDGLCLKSNKNRCYRAKGDRYKYLEAIIKNGGKPSSAKQLSQLTKGKKLEVNAKIVISRATKEMNELIKEKIGLDNFIIRGDSYRLNVQDFRVILG